MIALTSPYLWYSTRATGVVAILLLTLVVFLGTLVANRIGGTYIGRFEINELHRSLSMVAVIFLVLHIVTTVIDNYVATGWFSTVVPFVSPYKTTQVAIGTIAFDLILAVWISSLLKVRIKNSTWRFIHWFSWISYVTALVHAALIGTDMKGTTGLLFVAFCAGAVVLSALWRFFGRPTRAGGRTALSPLVSATRPAPKGKSGPTPFPREQRPTSKGRAHR
jgi:methionine sulfoxide reductase heme-binding subunit